MAFEIVCFERREPEPTLAEMLKDPRLSRHELATRRIEADYATHDRGALLLWYGAEPSPREIFAAGSWTHVRKVD